MCHVNTVVMLFDCDFESYCASSSIAVVVYHWLPEIFGLSRAEPCAQRVMPGHDGCFEMLKWLTPIQSQLYSLQLGRCRSLNAGIVNILSTPSSTVVVSELKLLQKRLAMTIFVLKITRCLDILLPCTSTSISWRIRSPTYE